MQLRQISYHEENHSLGHNPWSVNDVNLTDLNLIVGENSTGKTRLLNVIFNLSQMISEKRPLSPGNWNIVYDCDNTKFEYHLSISSSNVVLEEQVTVNGALRLNRGSGGAKIWNEKASEYDDIQPPQNKLTIQVRRDAAEYPFFEDLAEWADNLWSFRLSEVSASNILLTNIGSAKAPEVVSVPQILARTPEIFGMLNEDSVANIVRDMNSVGFKIDSIHAGRRPELQFATLLDVVEKGLDFPVSQMQLSNGFLRTLTLLVVVEYVVAVKQDMAITILVDDLDEGLDYGRASKLSKLLFKKLKGKNIQLLVSTNSSFIMNTVDISSWNVLIRKGSKVKALNAHNSKEVFERFRTTGLSNFEFFASDYLSGK